MLSSGLQRYVLITVTLALSGCGLMPSAKHVQDSTLPPIPAVTAPPLVAGAAVATDRTNAGWIDSCIRYVQRGAFAGDADLSALWAAADQDDNRIRVLCEGLTGPDFAALRDISLTTVSTMGATRR